MPALSSTMTEVRDQTEHGGCGEGNPLGAVPAANCGIIATTIAAIAVGAGGTPGAGQGPTNWVRRRSSGRWRTGPAARAAPPAACGSRGDGDLNAAGAIQRPRRRCAAGAAAAGARPRAAALQRSPASSCPSASGGRHARWPVAAQLTVRAPATAALPCPATTRPSPPTAPRCAPTPAASANRPQPTLCPLPPRPGPPPPPPTLPQGKIVSWLKSPGDKVAKGEPIVVVESDKADMDVESFNDGILGAIVVQVRGRGGRGLGRRASAMGPACPGEKRAETGFLYDGTAAPGALHCVGPRSGSPPSLPAWQRSRTAAPRAPLKARPRLAPATLAGGRARDCGRRHRLHRRDRRRRGRGQEEGRRLRRRRARAWCAHPEETLRGGGQARRPTAQGAKAAAPGTAFTEGGGGPP
jgi:biotin carboxyl carrier protein